MADRIDSHEYKTILRNARFHDPAAGMADFWGRVKQKTSVRDKPKNTKRRFVFYRDTPDFKLNQQHGFSFRERWDLENSGIPAAGKKISVKIRSADLDAVAGIDVDPNGGAERESKLERDVLLRVPSNDPPSADSKFSKSGSAEVSACEKFDKLSDAAKVFPVLGNLGLGDPELPIVREAGVHEVKFAPGSVVLGDCEAEASFTLWYEGGLEDTVAAFDGELLLVEFSFDFKLKKDCRAVTVHDEAIAFLERLGSGEWMEDGAKTKTQILYGW